MNKTMKCLKVNMFNFKYCKNIITKLVVLGCQYIADDKIKRQNIIAIKSDSNTTLS